MRTQMFGLQTRSTKASFLALVLALMALLAIEAEAWTRTHAFACATPQSTGPNGLTGGTPLDTNYALHNDSTTQDMAAVCPITDTYYIRKANITSLAVNGYDGHSSRRVSAMACRSFLGTTGGSCGGMAQSAVGRGDYTLSLDRSVWTAAPTSDYGYLWVQIPCKEGSSRSNLRGYITSGL